MPHFSPYQEIAARLSETGPEDFEAVLRAALAEGDMRAEWTIRGPKASRVPSAKCLAKELAGIATPTEADVRKAFEACTKQAGS